MKAVDIRVIRVLQNANDVIRRGFQVIDNQDPFSCLHDGRPSNRPVFRRRWHIALPRKNHSEHTRQYGGDQEQQHSFMGGKSYNHLRRMNKILLDAVHELRDLVQLLSEKRR
jgi:hypothetical protein